MSLSTSPEYYGEVERGKRHGKGKYTWTTGEEFNGHWATGARIGKGHLNYAVGTTHDGFWKDDEPEVNALIVVLARRSSIDKAKILSLMGKAQW